MSTTTVEFADGIIAVRPSFADMLTCSRLGGRWDGALKAWTFPATQQHARLIHSKLLKYHATDQFDALLQSIGANAEDGETVGASDSQSVEFPETIPANGQSDGEIVGASPAEPEIELPSGLVTRPWRHQNVAFKFCLDRFAAGMRGILLAMGMGTGKSLVACMLILALATRRVLIACPLRVVPVWITQFERHVGIPVLIVALDEEVGSVAKKQELAAAKMKLAQARGVPFIVVINYDSAWRDPFASWAEKVTWDLVIADEAHRLKAPGGKASLFFKRMRLRALHRVALTGTPMPHGPMDIYAVFRFLDITIFGPGYAPFRQKYAVMGGYQNKQIAGFQKLDELERLMSRITFRVGAEVLDLPPATHVTYTCDLTPAAQRIYNDLYEDFMARYCDRTITASNALVKLMRLQQLTGGCLPTDDGVSHQVDSSKRKLLADTLEDIGKDEPVVVFCRFHTDLDAVHEACDSMGYSSFELSGRRDELKRWQDGEAQVLAVQISAGGVGVDLTRARYSAYYSLSFSLGEYDQALARVHRPGQTRPVEHIHLVARSTVDVKIMRALEKRAEGVQAILAEIKNSPAGGNGEPDMNMEPLREFVSLETREKQLDAELKAAKQRLDELEAVIIPLFIEEGVPSMTVEVDGVKRTLSIYPDVYASPLNGREVEEQFGGAPRIKVMSGAALWLLPGLEREETAQKIEGIILLKRECPRVLRQQGRRQRCSRRS